MTVDHCAMSFLPFREALSLFLSILHPLIFGHTANFPFKQ